MDFLNHTHAQTTDHPRKSPFKPLIRILDIFSYQRGIPDMLFALKMDAEPL
jgi:hypothetical protein